MLFGVLERFSVQSDMWVVKGRMHRRFHRNTHRSSQHAVVMIFGERLECSGGALVLRSFWAFLGAPGMLLRCF